MVAHNFILKIGGFMKDDGAAEVIGVILIVAITVVLAAVIAAYAFGLGSSIKKPYQVYFSLSRSAPLNDVVITNYGGTDLSDLSAVEVSYTDNTGHQTDFQDPATIVTSNSPHASGALSTQYGTTLDLDSTIVNSYGSCRIVVRGTFKDGSKQVLLQGDI